MKMLRQRGAWLLLTAAAFVLGCYGPRRQDCMLECGPGMQCPDGMMCSNDRCTSATVCPADAGVATIGDAMDTSSATDTSDTTDASQAGDTADGDAPDDTTDASDAGDAADAGDVADDTSDASDVGDAPDDTTDASDASDVSKDTPNAAETGPDRPDGGGPDVSGPDVSGPGVSGPNVSDGGPPDGGEVSPPWKPSVIPNLVLWLEADRGLSVDNGEKITEWLDQSPLHNDATQDSAMFAPKLAANPFNGEPGVEFTIKTWLTIKDDQSLRWGVFDFLVLVVYRATARCEGPCILQQLYRKQEVERPWRGPGLGLQPSGDVEVHLDHDAAYQWLASPLDGYDSGRIHLVGALRRTNWPSVRVDGADFPAAVRPSVVPNLDAFGANVYIGAHGLNPDPPLDFPFSGYIGAIVAVQGPISAADLAQLESYLMVKYGAARGGPP